MATNRPLARRPKGVGHCVDVWAHVTRVNSERRLLEHSRPEMWSWSAAAFAAALIAASSIQVLGQAQPQQPPPQQSAQRRFEYKYSFKPPYLAQRDGSIPFWEYGGSESFDPFADR